MRAGSFWGLCLLAALVFGCRGERAKVADSDVTTPTKGLVVPELTAPIKIELAAVYADGGSSEVVLVGANDETLRLATPARLDAKPDQNFTEGGVYVGSLDDVKSGKGTTCPIPSRAATKIAAYLVQAYRGVDPTGDLNYMVRNKNSRLSPLVDLHHVKWMIHRIHVLETAAGDSIEHSEAP